MGLSMHEADPWVGVQPFLDSLDVGRATHLDRGAASRVGVLVDHLQAAAHGSQTVVARAL
jgi:hypothetical protein